ncbi:MAG: DNA-directed RNA polymerase subunit K [Candidatus Odinarchaeum yellowstonii]|uniref:DNA-directed RNA polymerase subunit Rpo6 n=1 Tax=Odinarchaeota yellowstonii (strain LCB_4) TaxID=1841599 RepID=A0AAF0D2C7_ODILC|nr:MAG: DNA-directed RNA polymerase subunit K [Candidatus Odinarchaeum yellowstonii]
MKNINNMSEDSSPTKKRAAKKPVVKKLGETEFIIKIGPPVLTRYERSRIIGARALQISMGAPILVDSQGKMDPIQIAEEELKNLILPIMVTRTLPSGESQSIPIKVLMSGS